MGIQSLEMRKLKRIPERFRKNPDKIYDQVPALLRAAYGGAQDLNDSFHVPLIIRSKYCSMDELKAWLKYNHPELILSPGWAMTGGLRGQDVKVTDYGGKTCIIPYQQYKALETKHNDRHVYEMIRDSWCIDLPRAQLNRLRPVLPCYIDENAIRRLTGIRIHWARHRDNRDELENRISLTGYSGALSPDILGALIDGMAYARQDRCVLYADLIE